MYRSLLFAAFLALPFLTSCSKGSEPMPAPVYLLDQRWVLMQVEGAPVASSSAGVSGTDLQLSSVGNSYTGQGFCNQYGGQYGLAVGAPQLRFTTQGSTFATCSYQDQESRYFQLLPQVSRYTISNHQLSLYDDIHAEPLLVFKAAE